MSSTDTTSATTNPEPTNSAPTNSAPTNSAPTNSAPANSAPANSAPANNDSSGDTKAEEKPQLNLLDVPVTDEHAALNVIVGFLGIAQRRGAFAINESAKIFECVKMFQKNEANSSSSQ